MSGQYPRRRISPILFGLQFPLPEESRTDVPAVKPDSDGSSGDCVPLVFLLPVHFPRR